VGPESSWAESSVPRGDDYDAQLAARLRGKNPHGEADFVEDLLRRSLGEQHEAGVICDGGCGTGRVAIELAQRGYSLVGVDNDPEMVAVARRKAPGLRWVLEDLASVDLQVSLNLVVLAGNVMVFVGRGHEKAVLRNLARQLVKGGLLVAGFQLIDGELGLEEYDRAAQEIGLYLVERWATWDRHTWNASAAYAVSVHERRDVGDTPMER
jgi:SAM-dependent methyltransferase